jgi:hypothetical protein
MELGHGPLLGLGRKAPRGLFTFFVLFPFSDFLFLLQLLQKGIKPISKFF